MAPGEFAVHYSLLDPQKNIGPYCAVFASLDDARAHAEEEVNRRPSLRCRIYDYRGFVGAPIAEICGTEYRNRDDFSPRARRWLGSFLFLVGLILCAIDWIRDFDLTWPATIGVRMVIPGAIMLMTELVLKMNERRRLSMKKM